MSSNSNKEEDEDFLYLEQVLDSLYDFGKFNRLLLLCDFCPIILFVIFLLSFLCITFLLWRFPLLRQSEAPQTAELKQKKQEELSLEQARLEVHRFGITGYKKEQQRVFEQHRAVMLGARPPKKDFVNYKELQRQMKEKKQKEKEEFQPDKKKKKKSNQRDKKKSSSGAGLGSAPSGQVGRFKNGMLVLNPKEIQKIKSNK
nr:uncharacterized protein C1orf131 homolog [Nothobranchius furzeri]